MSVLDFFDVFRMFVEEIENRGYTFEQRTEIQQQCIHALKEVLQNYSAGSVAPPQPQYQMLIGGIGKQQPQYQAQPQQHQQPMYAPQQQYQQPEYHQQQPMMQQMPQQMENKLAPSQSQPRLGAGPAQQMAAALNHASPADSNPDQSVMMAISSAVYGTGLKLPLVFKQINVSGDGVNDQQLVDGLSKLGVKANPDTIVRLAAPFKNGNVLLFGGFVKFLSLAESK